MMVDSMLGLPGRDRRASATSCSTPTIAARRHQAVRADGCDHRLGGHARQDRQGLDLQRHGARTDASRSPSATRSGDPCHNELPLGTDIHWHGITRPNDQDGVAPITQDVIATRRYATPTSSRPTSTDDRHVPRPPPRRDVGAQRDVRHASYVGDIPLPTAAPSPASRSPPTSKPASEIPMVLNDAGVIGLTLNGKSFPATAPVVVNEGDWVAGQLLQRGPAGPPDAPPRLPADSCTPRTASRSTSRTVADTILVAPGERYTVLFHATEPGTWVWHCHILNHVESRRRHVRHGHRSGGQPDTVGGGPAGGRGHGGRSSATVTVRVRALPTRGLTGAAGLHTGGRHERTDRTPRSRQLRP